MALILFIFILFLLLSAFFSASETAFLSLNKFQLNKMGDSPSTDRIVAILSRPRSFILTILTGNTLVNIAASCAATIFAVHHFGEMGVGIAIGVVLFALLIFGEVLPKTYAYLFAEKFAHFAVYPISIVIKILWPVRKVLSLITDSIIERLGVIAPKDTTEITEEEIKSMVKIGHREGVVEEIEKEMIYGVFDFKDQRAKDIMTHKIDIKALDFDMPSEKIIEYVKKVKNSRLPVFRDTVDNVIGIAFAKEILFNPSDNIKDMLREPYFVPESERIQKLLGDLQKRAIQLAVVTDEYGMTTGIVTMEDILEEIVGEIIDEYDKEKELITRIDENNYRLNGLLRIDEANKTFKLGIKTEEVDTMGGFVSLLMQKIPKENETVTYKKFEFKVVKVYRNRIQELLLTKK
ncbi:MAG: DUF21 domain-containing protein [Candidatus Omnitrophica bacterium]|nr:DUF21 domain-containing protein [Candidatus Omnitrophota bacterium]